MKDEVIGLKLHVTKEIGTLFVASTVSFVLVPDAVKFVAFRNYHECNASKHLGDKEEGLEDEPDLNAGGFMDVSDDEPDVVTVTGGFLHVLDDKTKIV